jgi:hypothetical protein
MAVTIYDFFIGHHCRILEDCAALGTIVWDIGASVGAVSLMFARKPWVERDFCVRTYAGDGRIGVAISCIKPRQSLGR